MLAGLRPLLEQADLAVINGEGVISAGGGFTYKGEPQSHMYRAHPLMTEVLAEAGIDVVAVGNNHACDYGRPALQEMLDRLTLAGLAYAGGGHDDADARQPSYHRVGDAVLAVVGADLTRARHCRADQDQPGLLHFDLQHELDEATQALTEILHQAREHAHVVLLTPHWGQNWADEPAPEHRELARRLIAAGYDGILGHSAHVLQGAELIDGKPVIYDMGNVLLDYDPRIAATASLLWELEFTRAGITAAHGHPLSLRTNRSALARGERARPMLERLQRLSAELGTPVELQGDSALLRCDPGGLRGPELVAPPPARQAPAQLRRAPSDTLQPALPSCAEAAQLRYANGVSLLGYKLLLEEIPPHGGQLVLLYWTTERPIERSLLVHLESRGKDRQGEAQTNLASHLPGDWLLPTTDWQPGQVIADWTLFRLKYWPDPAVSYFVGLWDGQRMLQPIRSDRPLEDGQLYPLGTARRRKGAEGSFEVLERFRASGCHPQ